MPLLMYVQYAAEGPSSPGNLSEPADGRLDKVDASGCAASTGADGIRRQALRPQSVPEPQHQDVNWYLTVGY
ncbi:hypothetical protein SAMN05216215_10552 [Saccharopolyspora shandongensis]|uniref:Uncharacterized protein n=1 Tax=Saccharopolyspora shandongensis TaxID=418495 RepID=A0A1H3RLG1_9PSEU|nr:hypothetical protein SAMN05216215_10552 [Saccharopolyspora shandongensis]